MARTHRSSCPHCGSRPPWAYQLDTLTMFAPPRPPRKPRPKKVKPAPYVPPGEDLLVLFAVGGPWAPPPPLKPKGEPLPEGTRARAKRPDWSSSLAGGVQMTVHRSTDRPEVLDLGARQRDVERISRSRPEYARCVRAGIPRGDLDAEVMLQLLLRQRPGLRSRYDPERSGVAKYLNMICRSILLNILDMPRFKEGKDLALDDMDHLPAALVSTDKGQPSPSLIEEIVSSYEDEDMPTVRAILTGAMGPEACTNRALVSELRADLAKRARTAV